jgi:hypothetical protein
MKIYQRGGRLDAIDAAEVTRLGLLKFTRSEATTRRSKLWRFDLTPARHPSRQQLSPRHNLAFTPLSNDHVMIPQCSILWPIEDVGTNGYCYGWILNPRLVCVAGVLQVGSLRQLCSSSPTLSY